MNVNMKKLFGYGLVAFFTCGVIVSTFVLYSLAGPKEVPQPPDRLKTCMKPECIIFAGNCLRSMDFHKNPCQSFYSFVCGKYSYEYPKPENRNKISEVKLLYDKVEYNLRRIVAQPILRSDPRHMKIFKKYYRACIDTKTIEKNGLERARQIIEELGGWPVVKDLEPEITWDQVMTRIFNLGFQGDYLIKFDVFRSKDNANYNIYLNVVPSVLVLAADRTSFNQYHEFMVNVSKKFGANDSGDMLETLKFSIEPYKLVVNEFVPSILRNILNYYKEYTLKELSNEFPNIPWRQYLTGAVQRAVRITNDQKINVLFPKYLTALSQVLNKTEPRIIRNFLVFKALEELMPYLNRELEDILWKQQEQFFAISESVPRWTKCLKITMKTFDIIATSSYVRRKFNRRSKLAAENFVGSIKNGLLEMVNNTNWDKEDKLKASDKLSNMHEVIGYPIELLNVTLVDDYYKPLEINGGDYASVALNVSKFLRHVKVRLLSERVDRKDWRLLGDMLKMRADHVFKINAFVISAPYFDGMYYNRNVPNYINLGTLGRLVATAMSMAITGMGQQLDLNGAFTEVRPNRDHFNETRSCIAEQNSQNDFYRFEGFDGSFTFMLNVADLAGWKTAYHIYRKQQRSYGPEESLPGLNFTKSQLFWIAGTAAQCSSSKRGYAQEQLFENLDVPNEVRIDGTFRNIEEFAKDFDCPRGSYMNPEVKCAIF